MWMLDAMSLLNPPFLYILKIYTFEQHANSIAYIPIMGSDELQGSGV